MSGRVHEQVAIVTGGGNGMGRAHSLALAGEGAAVVVTDIDRSSGEITVKEIIAAGGKATFFEHDVTSSADWNRILNETIGLYGKIDVLVNNAGILILKPLDETEEAEWDQIMSINAKGVFLGCKLVAPLMGKTGGGSIINVSSIYGLVGAPSAAAYEASKGAVRLLSKAAALDLNKFGIRVNSVHPGVIATAMTKDLLATPDVAAAVLGPTILGRPGQPEEVSAMVLFLASSESSFCTGAEFVVDGGYTAS